ncbi:hypothetical protein LTR62_000281 [Meristemomyces frigidus]|uniref:Uncharacterized protein n=1 Tax=Meristemomyces frigidus TaxID=1508187 RepID=A0AAN7TJC6_9PEZI|nr:hypothetical protein LTR62_000281 [Meristemomyces frigidus]
MSADSYRLSNLLHSPGLHTDKVLTHLNRVLATSAGVEATLCTLCYTLYFVHSRLLRIRKTKHSPLAITLATKVSTLILPGETLVASISPPKSYLSGTCASVKALADLTNDVRYFTRLWGLIPIYNWAKDHYLKPPGDASLKALIWGQVLMFSTFQVLENGAYLASKGILKGEAWHRRQPKWWVWSNRFCLAYLGLEGLRLLRIRQLRYNEDFGAKNTTSDEDEGMVRIESEALRRKWQSEFYVGAGWLPLTLQRSFGDQSAGPLDETWIGICGMIPGIIALGNVWQQTKE